MGCSKLLLFSHECAPVSCADHTDMGCSKLLLFSHEYAPVSCADLKDLQGSLVRREVPLSVVKSRPGPEKGLQVLTVSTSSPQKRDACEIHADK
jgi:hypothetical protein